MVRQLTQKFINVLFTLAFVFQACTGSKPESTDFVGEWKARDDAVLIFKKDQTFSAKNLVGDIIFKGFDEYYGKKFNEAGTWDLRQSQGEWILVLSFTKSDNLDKGFSTELLIRGGGIFENTPPWKLLLWEEEEGGKRYEFLKN